MFSLHRASIILATFAFIGAAGGCGQTGPLYLPGAPAPATSQIETSATQSAETPTQPDSR